MIVTKRVYEPADPGDGYRALVDRLWPRGLKRADAAIDAWLKDVAPSTELRKWFAHEESRWAEFQRRYAVELEAPEAQRMLDDLRSHAKRGTVTLLYAAREERHNSACVLRDVLTGRPPR